MFWCYLYFGQFSSVICLFLCVFQSQTLIFLILVHLMFINFLLPWIHRNFVFVPYFSRRSWFRWRIFGPGRTSLVRWMFFSMLRSTFIISVDQVFSPFSSVELPYFDEFIVFPSLLSSKLLISVTDFFLVIFGRNFQFRWIVFSMCIPSLFQWTVLVEIPCFSQWIMFFRPRFGRNYFLFLSHPYFGQNCPFFRCIFLFSAYSHRNFGQFFVLPLIPVEIPFFVFFPSAFFATKFRPDRKYHFFTSYSCQNSVFFRDLFFPRLIQAEIRWNSDFFGDLFVSLRSRGISLLWRFIFSLPYSHLFASKLLISVIYLLFCNFSTLSFFPSIFGKNAEIIRNLGGNKPEKISSPKVNFDR